MFREIDYLGRPSKTLPAVLTGQHKKLTTKKLFKQKEHLNEINEPIDLYSGQTLLFLACAASKANTEVIQELFANGAHSYLTDKLGRTIVHIAANTADPARLEELLSWSDIAPYVDKVDSNGQTPFHALCYQQDARNIRDNNANLIKCFEMMLARSANYNDPWQVLTTPDKIGLTPLMLAKYYNMQEFLTYIDSFGAEQVADVKLPLDIVAKLSNYSYQRTPLTMAVLMNDFKAVNAALITYSDDEIDPHSGLNALQLACCCATDLQIVAKLLKVVQNPVKQDAYGRTALHFAASINNFAMVQMLLENTLIQQNINLVDNKQRTALHALVIGLGKQIIGELQQVTEQQAKERQESAKAIIELFADKGLNFEQRATDRSSAESLSYFYDNEFIAKEISSFAAKISAAYKEQGTRVYLESTSPLYTPGFKFSFPEFLPSADEEHKVENAQNPHRSSFAL